MTHPLFDLLKTRTEPIPTARPSAAKVPLADAAMAVEPVADGGGCVVGGVHVGLGGPHVPHVAILGVQSPPLPDGRPGATTFAPGIPEWLQREIVQDLEFFDVRVRRRAQPVWQSEEDEDAQEE